VVNNFLDFQLIIQSLSSAAPPSSLSSFFTSSTYTGSWSGVGSGWMLYSTGSLKTTGGFTGKYYVYSYLWPLPT
jgi:hypothetical protein